MKLTKREIEELIEEWQPEPLVPQLDENDQAMIQNMHLIESYDGPYVQIRGLAKRALNMASFDFLGMSTYPPLKEVSAKALDKVTNRLNCLSRLR